MNAFVSLKREGYEEAVFLWEQHYYTLRWVFLGKII